MSFKLEMDGWNLNMVVEVLEAGGGRRQRSMVEDDGRGRRYLETTSIWLGVCSTRLGPLTISY
jgi:hypothetical protein